MPKLATTDFDLSIAQEFLKRRKLRHLHTKRRADTLTLIAGPSDDPWPRARFRLLTKQHWTLDVADAAGRWERLPSKRRSATFSISSPTPFPGCSLISNPERTSDRMY